MKLSLQTESFMENFGRSKILHQRTRLNFQTAPTNMVTWNLQTYWVIQTMTTTGYNIRNSKSDLPLLNFREV